MSTSREEILKATIPMPNSPTQQEMFLAYKFQREWLIKQRIGLQDRFRNLSIDIDLHYVPLTAMHEVVVRATRKTDNGEIQRQVQLTGFPQEHLLAELGLLNCE